MQPKSPEVSRRTVLMGVGVVGAAAAVAACGGSQASPTSASATSAAPTSGPAPSTSAAPTSATPSGQSLGPAADVPVGGGKVFSDRGIVVTQPSSGQYAAFTAECPHQGCLVSEVRDNQIVCPCHQSLFSAQTGAVEQGPATTGLVPIPITVADGNLIVS